MSQQATGLDFSGWAKNVVPQSDTLPMGSSLQHHGRMAKDRAVIHVNAINAILFRELFPIFREVSCSSGGMPNRLTILECFVPSNTGRWKRN